MATANTAWCLLIDQENKPSGDYFAVSVTDADYIADLREKVKAKLSPILDHVALPFIMVWRIPESLGEEGEARERQIGQAFASGGVVQLGGMQTMADLGLKEKEVLLVRLPSAFEITTLDRPANPPTIGTFGKRRKKRKREEEEEEDTALTNRQKFIEGEIQTHYTIWLL